MSNHLVTISYTSGLPYLLLGMETSSISSKANACDVYTQTQVDNELSAKVNQSTAYTKTEVDGVVGTTANKSAMAGALGGKQSSITTSTDLILNSITANQVYSRYYSASTGNTDRRHQESEVY